MPAESKRRAALEALPAETSPAAVNTPSSNLLLPGGETTSSAPLSSIDPTSPLPDTTCTADDAITDPATVATEPQSDQEMPVTSMPSVLAPTRLAESGMVVPWSAKTGRNSLYVHAMIQKRRDFTFGDGSQVKWQSKTNKGILYYPAKKSERQRKELFPQPFRTEVVSTSPFLLITPILNSVCRLTEVVSDVALSIRLPYGTASFLSTILRAMPHPAV